MTALSAPRLRPVAVAGAVAAALMVLLLAPGGARAITGDIAIPGNPVLVTSMTKPPAGYTLTARRVLAIASADSRVKAYLRRHPKAVPYEYTKSEGTWQVSWFSPGAKPKELLQVYVDDHTGTVTQVWSGFQVAWSMARGYAGAFGRRVNALYLWMPLCVLFVAPFFPWRRRAVAAAPGPADAARLLDLAGLLQPRRDRAVGAAGVSVPGLPAGCACCCWPSARAVPREPLRLIVPINWLLFGAMFLIGLRIGLNILNSNVIDVGYAGVIGADKLIHGHLLYGLWPKDNAYGDTYGPVNYLRLRPLPPDLRLERQLGLAAGRPCRGDRLRPVHRRRALPAGAPDAQPRHGCGVRLRLGRLPVHALGAELQHQRLRSSARWWCWPCW